MAGTQSASRASGACEQAAADRTRSSLATTYRDQAILLSQQGRFAESEAYSREALRLRPDDIDVLNELGAGGLAAGTAGRGRGDLTARRVRSSPTTSGS